MSCMACRLKLSSTLVNGVYSRWETATKNTSKPIFKRNVFLFCTTGFCLTHFSITTLYHYLVSNKCYIMRSGIDRGDVDFYGVELINNFSIKI